MAARIPTRAAGGNRIGAVVPGVGDEGGAGRLFADDALVPVQRLVDENRPQGSRRGHFAGHAVGTRLDDVPDLVGDARAREDDDAADDRFADGFGAAVAVRVLRVGGHAAELVGEKNDSVGDQVGKGVDGVGDERGAVTENSADEFDQRKKQVGGRADKGRLHACAHFKKSGHGPSGSSPSAPQGAWGPP